MSKNWTINKSVKSFPKLKSPVLIEGMPGIGNVGKVAADFLIDELKAQKLCEFFSYTLPNSVFVTENNLIELPKIEMFYKKGGKKDILILTGDVQPIEEVSCYEFCDKVLDLFTKLGGSDIITLGGIGISAAPKNPKVYCTANSRKMITRYSKKVKLNNNIYGVVGPIVGVSGLLLGLGKRRNIEAMSLLAETYRHPMYLGVKGSRRILKMLVQALDLEVDMAQMDKELKSMEEEALQQSGELAGITSDMAMQALKDRVRSETRYIG